jgi:hypothetical protein
MKIRTLSSLADRTRTGRRFLVSRRAALAGFAMTTASGTAFGQLAADNRTAEPNAGPSFSALGPHAEVYGAGKGYPIPSPSLARLQGNPFAPGYRVGAFSHFDELFPTRSIKRADTHWEWKRSASELRYSYQGGPSSLEDICHGILSQASSSPKTTAFSSSTINMREPTGTGCFRNRLSSRSWAS